MAYPSTTGSYINQGIYIILVVHRNESLQLKTIAKIKNKLKDATSKDKKNETTEVMILLIYADMDTVSETESIIRRFYCLCILHIIYIN